MQARRRAGFTLIELMVTVTIIAILAAIGSYAYGRLTKRSRTNEAITFFAAVSGAQTAYYDLYGQFGATDTTSPYDAWDPALSDIESSAHQWSAPAAAWQQIGVSLPRNTWFAYVVVAGDPDDLACEPPPDVATDGGGSVDIPACDSIDVGSYWYYIVGRADQDGDTFTSCFGSSSTMSGAHWSVEALDIE